MEDINYGILLINTMRTESIDINGFTYKPGLMIIDCVKHQELIKLYTTSRIGINYDYVKSQNIEVTHFRMPADNFLHLRC